MTIVFNSFVSPLVQKVTVFDILPLSEDLLETDSEERERDTLQGDFIFEPEPEEILARLLPVYIETELYRALLESAASKHGAQMTAMRNASKNAGELIDTLTLAMNRARQAEITQEILEVVAARPRGEGEGGNREVSLKRNPRRTRRSQRRGPSRRTVQEEGGSRGKHGFPRGS